MNGIETWNGIKTRKAKNIGLQMQLGMFLDKMAYADKGLNVALGKLVMKRRMKEVRGPLAVRSDNRRGKNFNRSLGRRKVPERVISLVEKTTQTPLQVNSGPMPAQQRHLHSTTSRASAKRVGHGCCSLSERQVLMGKGCKDGNTSAHEEGQDAAGFVG